MAIAFSPGGGSRYFSPYPYDCHPYAKAESAGAIITGKGSPSPFLDSARRHVRRHGMLHRIAEGSHMYPLEKPEQTLALFRETLQTLQQGEAS